MKIFFLRNVNDFFYTMYRCAHVLQCSFFLSLSLYSYVSFFVFSSRHAYIHTLNCMYTHILTFLTIELLPRNKIKHFFF